MLVLGGTTVLPWHRNTTNTAVLAYTCNFSKDMRAIGAKKIISKTNTPASMNSSCVPVENVLGRPRLHQLDTHVPTVQTSIGQRSFAFCGPIV